MLRLAARHGLAIVSELAGAQRLFGIRGAYHHRAKVMHFDDTAFKDEYQREVYERAAHIAAMERCSTIYDVGCGSGYKLIKYLGDYDTTGFEVPQTLEYLRRQYPDRKWAKASDRVGAPADLVICSDVIEHVDNPDDLMRLLISLTRKWLVISTPDRHRSYSRFSTYQLGPPQTEHHAREWSFREFEKYVRGFVDVREHQHSNNIHATQIVVSTKR